MNFITAMEQRYTTKMYDQTRKLNPTQREELKEILRISPSSINSQPWNFTFVTDAETKMKLAEVSNFNAQSVINCDTLVVFSRINNLQLFENQIAEQLPAAAVDYYKRVVKPKSDEQIKTWFAKQVYLSLGVFLSACAEMKIDSTPMEGIDPEKYDTILGSTDYCTLVAVAIGYRDSEDPNQLEKKSKSRKPINEVVKSI